MAGMIKTTLYVIAGILLLAILLIQLGALSGRRPDDLGVRDGRLKPPSQTPNSVSSQAALHPGHPQRVYAEIAPLPFKPGGAGASMDALAAVLAGMPGIRVVQQTPDYLYAQAQTRWLKFTDDLEFWANPARNALELRSASRLGRRDFGVNRERIEVIRAAYLAQGH